MSAFTEKFILGALSAAAVALALTNPMKFDAFQRITGLVAVVAIVLFCDHTLELRKKESKLEGGNASTPSDPAPKPSTEPPPSQSKSPMTPTGPTQTTQGDKSPITGDKTNINYGTQNGAGDTTQTANADHGAIVQNIGPGGTGYIFQNPDVSRDLKEIKESVKRLEDQVQKLTAQLSGSGVDIWHERYPNGYSIFALSKDYVIVPGSDQGPHALQLDWHKVSAKFDSEHLRISVPAISGENFASGGNISLVDVSKIQVGFTQRLFHVDEIELMVEVAHTTADGLVLVFGARPMAYYWRVYDSAVADSSTGIDVFISLGIRNQTPAMHLRNWRSAIIWRDGRKVSSTAVAGDSEIPEGWNIALYLPALFAHEPCPVGMPVDGWIQFHFPNVKREELPEWTMMAIEYDRTERTEHYDFPIYKKPPQKLQFKAYH